MNSWSHSCLYNLQIFVFTSGEYVEACFASPPSPVLISIISVLSVSLCKFPASVSFFVNLTLSMCSFFLVFNSQSISPVQEKFLDIAKNVVHNMSVLIIQCGYCISDQVFSSFLCFLATLKPLSFVILLNFGVNPGSLGTVTTPVQLLHHCFYCLFLSSLLEFLSWCVHYLRIPPRYFLIHFESTVDHIVLFLCPIVLWLFLFYAFSVTELFLDGNTGVFFLVVHAELHLFSLSVDIWF